MLFISSTFSCLLLLLQQLALFCSVRCFTHLIWKDVGEHKQQQQQLQQLQQRSKGSTAKAAQQRQCRRRQQRQPLKSRWVFIINDITTTNWVTGKRQQRWSRTRITFYVIYCNFVGRPPWQARALPLAPCCTFSFRAAARQHKGAPPFLTKWASSRQQQMLLHT